jgi:hypothetical protein
MSRTSEGCVIDIASTGIGVVSGSGDLQNNFFLMDNEVNSTVTYNFLNNLKLQEKNLITNGSKESLNNPLLYKKKEKKKKKKKNKKKKKKKKKEKKTGKKTKTEVSNQFHTFMVNIPEHSNWNNIEQILSIFHQGMENSAQINSDDIHVTTKIINSTEKQNRINYYTALCHEARVNLS